MTVTIVGDFADPLSFLASQRLDQLNTSGVSDITWLAVESDHLRPMGGRPLDDAAARRVSGLAVAGEAIPAGGVRVVNSRAATSAYAESLTDGVCDEMRHALFAALWVHGRSIADTEVIRSIVFAVGNPGPLVDLQARMQNDQPIVAFTDVDVLADTRRLGFTVSGAGGPLTGDGQRRIDIWRQLWDDHGNPPIPLVIREDGGPAPKVVLDSERALEWLAVQVSRCRPARSVPGRSPEGREPAGWADTRPEQLGTVVGLAGRAPNLYNTQPWRFHAHGDTIELWADRDRSLPIVDAAGRELEIACGAVLGHLELALAAAGRDPGVTLCPDPDRGDLLALVDVSQNAEPTASQRVLAEQIPLRCGNRHPFSDQAVDAGVVSDLMSLVSAAEAWLLLIRDEDRTELAVLIREAEQDLQSLPAYRAELSAWTTEDPLRVDGVLLSEIPGDASPAGIAVRAFDPHAPLAPGRVLDDAPVLIMLGTDRDDLDAHLHAGRALAVLLLHVQARGLSASIHAQPFERLDCRTILAERAGGGYSQLLIRIGHCDQPGSCSRRRPVSALLTNAAVTGPGPPRG